MLNWDAWAAIIGHMVSFHQKGRWWGVRLAEVTDNVEVCMGGWVVAQIGIQLGPIIGVNKVVIRLMDNVDIPAHKTHLQAEDGLIGAIVQKDKLDCITVSHLNKSTPVAHMAYLVHSPVPTEPLA
jgi:hypothetical protein